MASEASNLTRAAFSGLQRLTSGDPTPDALNAALRHLCKWRAALLDNTLVARSGTSVLSGPFKGMSYPVIASEGSRSARLLGAYEASLSPIVETIIARGYPLVIDVGSAEGYYAVGLARRMPGSRILARDASERAQALCRKLAEANGVSDRVEVGGLFTHADFDICSTQPTVAIVDIEGAEDELLDPLAAPGLRTTDILVEVHEGMKPGLLARIEQRFLSTHAITRIGRRLAPEALPDWTEALSDLDRLLLLWEWRSSPTPWLWLEAAK